METVTEKLVVQEAPADAAAPLVFRPTDRRLFGFFHAPQGPSLHATGVVLCNPLGYEAMCAHRTYRHMAERLAARGFAALRFDYDGTGDSSGQFDDPGRVRAWIDSIHAAVDELRVRSGARRVALFGVRFAATLAVLAAGERTDVESLILWAPCPSGRAYVRELRALRMIKNPKLEARPDGGEEVAGYLFGAETLATMSAIDLFGRTGRVVDRALVVPRDDVPGAESRLAKHLEASGIAVRLATEGGYASMMRDPQDTEVPLATLDSMIAWLGEAMHPEKAPPRPAARAPSVLASTGVRETAVLFGGGERLFGIVTEPTSQLVRPDRPALVLINVGANHHVGPNRMYVVLARDLAARGYLSLRFDVAGLGDSRVVPGGTENRLYARESVGDVRTAMTYLSQTRGARRFVLMGLCSGAYLAFHAAIEDPRVVGQVLLNTQTFEWNEGDSIELSMSNGFLSTRYYAKALFDRDVWGRALRGDVQVRRIAGELRNRVRARVSASFRTLSARLRGSSTPQSNVERAFHSLCDRGVESLLIFSFDEGGLDMIAKHLGGDARNMRRRRNFKLEVVEGADHTFTPLASQRALYGLVTRYLTRFP